MKTKFDKELEIVGILDKIRNFEKILTKSKGYEENHLFKFAGDRVIEDLDSDSTVREKILDPSLSY